MSKLTLLPEGAPMFWPVEDNPSDCPAEYEDDERFLLCTGPRGHGGAHVAEGMSHSLAMWEGE